MSTAMTDHPRGTAAIDPAVDDSPMEPALSFGEDETSAQVAEYGFLAGFTAGAVAGMVTIAIAAAAARLF